MNGLKKFVFKINNEQDDRFVFEKSNTIGFTNIYKTPGK